LRTYDLPMPLAVGEVFAGYTILRVLGAGGMGTGAFHRPPAIFGPLVFSNGSWTQVTSVDQKCPSGDTSHVKRNVQYPLPQPAQDPITLLIGHGHQQQTGSCALSTDITDTLTRIGD
jgi:hypothetical protein